jgi:hypothetical protein
MDSGKAISTDKAKATLALNPLTSHSQAGLALPNRVSRTGEEMVPRGKIGPEAEVQVAPLATLSRRTTRIKASIGSTDLPLIRASIVSTDLALIKVSIGRNTVNNRMLAVSTLPIELRSDPQSLSPTCHFEPGAIPI